MEKDFNELWTFAEHLEKSRELQQLNRNDKKIRKKLSQCEEKMFRECLEEVAKIDKRFGSHKILKVYYGSENDRQQIAEFIGVNYK